MKNIKKIAALVLSIALVCCAFAGCGVKDASSTDTGSKAEKLVMGTNATFPPYEYVDDNNKIAGIDAEVAQAIADKLGMTLTIKDMEFESLISAVNGGSIDMILAGMTVTEERKESVDFSESYAKGVQVIIVKEGSSIKAAADLKGKKIGVQSGTTGDIYCSDEFGEENVKQYTDGVKAVAALMNDQVDCVVIDNEPAKNYVKANEGLKILDTAYADEDYAIAVSKGNSDLLKKINDALAELKADGTIDRIVAKYIK